MIDSIVLYGAPVLIWLAVIPIVVGVIDRYDLADWDEPQKWVFAFLWPITLIIGYGSMILVEGFVFFIEKTLVKLFTKIAKRIATRKPKLPRARVER